MLTMYIATTDSLATDIIGGTCVAWAAYGSYATKKTVNILTFIITYALPLTLMVFCYTNVVRALRRKVTLKLSPVGVLP